jgi:hypothetical protein
MPVKINNNNVKESSWNAEFNIFGTGDMCFSLNGSALLKSEGIELGILKEANGVEKICRSHFSDKTGWSWVETETFHPFGSEPVIKRKWEQAGNHIRVVSDIIIRGSIPVDHVSIDSLKLPGKWKKGLIFSQLNPDSTEISIEEIDLSDFLGKEKKFTYMPLVMVLTAEDGTELEIGAGYDLWRWHEAGSRFGGEEEYLLKGTGDGLFFDRKISFHDDEFELGRDNFRFSWYFAWACESIVSVKYDLFNKLTPSGRKLISDNRVEEHVYCLDGPAWPLIASAEGNPEKHPCFCSRQTGNYLKSWLRSLYHKIKDDEIDVYLCGIDTHICSNASHMVRGKRINLMHWDYIYLLSFWEWANKYMGSTDNCLYIIFKKNSPFADLPSVKGLSDRFSPEVK